jgi:hypothetical protein
MSDFRLGDIIDDHCIKCRRVTNHAIVSLVNAEPAKVRCRTCYHDHDYRHEQAPPSKKDLKKAELFKEVLAAAVPGAIAEDEVAAVVGVPAEIGVAAAELGVVAELGAVADIDAPEIDASEIEASTVEVPAATSAVPTIDGPAKPVKKTATRGKKA